MSEATVTSSVYVDDYDDYAVAAERMFAMFDNANSDVNTPCLKKRPTFDLL